MLYPLSYEGVSLVCAAQGPFLRTGTCATLWSCVSTASVNLREAALQATCGVLSTAVKEMAVDVQRHRADAWPLTVWTYFTLWP